MKKKYKRTPVEREAFNIIGKGWSVGSIPPSTKNLVQKFAAIVRMPDRKSKTVGCRETMEDAAHLAAAAARQYGTLDWAKTVRWFKVMGLNLDYQRTFNFAYAPKGKGWYVRKSTTSWGTTTWIAYTGYSTRSEGKSKHHLVTVCSRKSRKVAVEHAVKAAKGTEHYNEAATVLWLERNGMGDLIDWREQ